MAASSVFSHDVGSRRATDSCLRILSWNILAPELLQYFWRSSYGLPLLHSASHYEALTIARLTAMVSQVRELAPDVLLLQEVTDTAFSALGGQTTAAWLANALGMELAGSSFKHAPFRYSLPPHEQPGPERAGSPSSSAQSADSGVATLFAPARVALVAHLLDASAVGPSTLFRSGVGSPFSVDAVQLRSRSGSQPLVLVNTHIRMQYPRIAAPLAELLARASRAAPAGWARTVIAGDLNAGHVAAAADLAAALQAASGALSDVPLAGAPAGEPADDHALVGAGVRVLQAARVAVPLLAMSDGCGGGAATSDHKLWGRATTPYAVHADNASLIASGRVTSDHPPLLVDVAWDDLS